MFWYSSVRGIFLFLIRIFLRFKSRNAAAVPASGGVILVSNHESFLDPILVGCATTRQPVRFMARESLFHAPGFGFLLPRIKAFPVRRGGADRAAWAKFEELVKEGEMVCFFPEGTRSVDGQLRPAVTGAGMLIHRCPGAVVLPVRVFDSRKVLHKDKGFQGFHKVSVAFGSPIDIRELWLQPGSREVYEQINVRVMDGIRAIAPPSGP
ncbi:MAG: lysophospholipid acyltransferase family protein [candidate division FCPU426 bacterium]